MDQNSEISPDMISDNIGFVAVHVGAGYHSPANSELYKQVCKDACFAAKEILQSKEGSALEATAAAIRTMEDSQYTNAGTGSNLTVQGTVECDASIMDGSSLHYGAVGAIRGIKNPISVAECLLCTQKAGTMSLGRIPPSTMVGDGAREWASRAGITVVAEEALMTDASKKAFIKHKRKLDMLDEGYNNQAKRGRLDLNQGSNGTDGTVDDHLLDTVGAVCVDNTGTVVSAVSSGGIVLKQPGRVGQAALYGCGCWAENASYGTSSNIGVGVTTSGCGEHLTKTLLAKECSQLVKEKNTDPTKAMTDVFQKKFLESPFLKDIQQKLGGALAILANKNQEDSLDVEVLWSHTTDSMCLAYMTTADSQPKALISRLPEGKTCGRSFVVQSRTYSIRGSQDGETG